MSDYISREAATADSDRNKIKTPFAGIVVEGTPGKPYYNIWYFDPADGECHIGFGSYCLDNVFNWLAEEFEVMEPAAAIERWAKNQPSRIRFFAVRRWLKEMPRKENFYAAD